MEDAPVSLTIKGGLFLSERMLFAPGFVNDLNLFVGLNLALCLKKSDDLITEDELEMKNYMH